MVNDPNQFLYDFRIDLERFGAEVAGGALRVFREAADRAVRGVVIGNEYGPGVPVDTGWARASFRTALNAPADGPTEPPMRTEQGEGKVQFDTPTMSAAAMAALGDTIYANTMASYPQYLEFNPKRRRFGEKAGQSTEFIAPIEMRWQQIVDDAARVVGYGA